MALRRVAAAVAASSAVLAAGCASVPPAERQASAQAALVLPAPLIAAAQPASAVAPPQAASSAKPMLTLAEALARAQSASPALRARLAQADAAIATQHWQARPSLLHFGIERVVGGGEVEWSRSVSIALLDWLLWPLRQAQADRAELAERLQLARDVQAHYVSVQQKWVAAVAARQQLALAEAFSRSAATGAEFAKRMQAAGNFTALDHARQQSFSLQAERALWQAESEANRTAAALFAAMGESASAWGLPAALPPLPKDAPGSIEKLDVNARVDARLDVQLAAARRDAPSPWWSGWGIEAGARRDHIEPAGGAAAEHKRGIELGVSVPLPGAGDALAAQRAAAQAQWQATRAHAAADLAQAQANRQAAWRAAHQIYTQQWPLAQRIAQEQLLRYNAMIIGVFELFASARESVQAQQDATAALARYWQAEADWQQALLGAGQPGLDTAGAAPAMPAAAAQGH